jgi:polyferredoxin
MTNLKKLIWPMNPRQKVRRSVLMLFSLAFPITYKYLSPYIPVDGAANGIITGSLLFFILLFILALYFGRAFCGWVCPAAGMQEWSFSIKNDKAKGGRLNWIKYFIWVPWLGAIIALTIFAGGYTKINIFHLIDYGISVSQPLDFIMYFIVVGIILLLSLTAGKRAFCHYGCWIAPFMVIGDKIKGFLRLPSLHLKAESARCTRCHICNERCPMSLPVEDMVQSGSMKNSECVLCGHCVDTCPANAIAYSWGNQGRK